jgi:hypothetical protein
MKKNFLSHSFTPTTTMNPMMTIDSENGMLICGCGIEADDNGYCGDCLPLRIVLDDISESKPLRKPVDEDDIPLAVLARKKAQHLQNIRAQEEREKKRKSKVECHHCSGPTKINQTHECDHCGLYLDLVVIKGKMVKRFITKGKKEFDRIESHESEFVFDRSWYWNCEYK